MTSMTAAYSAPRANPPLPFTRDAIINQLRRQATNGPAYVQHSATKALAHLKGLYAEARYEARQRFDAVRNTAQQTTDQAAQQTAEQISSGYQRATEIMNGAEVTEADLGGFARFFKKATSEQEDEEGSTQDDDEPH